MDESTELSSPSPAEPTLEHGTGSAPSDGLESNGAAGPARPAARDANGTTGATTGESEIDRVLPAMRGLRSRARVTNLTRAAQLESALERAAVGDLDQAGRAQAVAVAHQLIGSAGTFGFAEASRRAQELKEFFASGQIDDEDVQNARMRLIALRDDLQNGGGEIDF